MEHLMFWNCLYFFMQVYRRKGKRSMNIVLWVVQALLAIMFLMAGGMKASQPLDKLAKNMGWVKQYPAAFTRFIGIAEVLGAIGLILPPLVHILPWLTIAAAVGLALAMLCAVIFHIMRKEYTGFVAPLVLLLLSLFVAYGRLVIAPF